MKKLIISFLFLPLFSMAQECKLKSSTDPFTHETKLSTGFMNFDKGSLKLLVSVDATPSVIDFFFWVKNDGRCFEDESYAEIIFEGDKSKMRVKNSGSMNCDGAFHFSYKNTPATTYQLNKLATKKVTSIKLVGNNKTETNIFPTEEQQNLLMQAATCAANEGKKLIKK
jgi:hypothetical protein